MYNENSILSRGKYKLWRVKDVPASYFVRIHDNGFGGCEPELKQYIIENIESLRLRSLGIETPPIAPVPFICDKRTFPTEKDARQSLRTIRNSKGDHKKPIRVYECPKCSGWHLTSVPIEVLKTN